FTFLRERLRQDLPNKKVIIDITGAKKTMVVGAFMLAAYSQAEMYYIDTECYEKGRPYGFSCRFRPVANPLKELSLDIWQQIEERYKRCDFAGALSLLTSEFVKSQPMDLGDFQRFLELCNCWENGRLRRARELSGGLPEIFHELVPNSVMELGDLWPDDQGHYGSAQAFFRSRRLVLIYAIDELYRSIRQKENGLYRLAFSRAYALYETLIKAIVAAWYIDRQIKVGERTNGRFVSSKDLTTELLEDGLTWLVNLPAGEVQKLARGNWRQGRFESGQITYQVEAEGSLNEIYFANGTLKEKRNSITHSYFPVTAELALEAIELAARNLNYYRSQGDDKASSGKPLSDLMAQYSSQAPDWDTLIRICDLHFIPAKRQKGG
ncbi:MAG: hypothetical protein L0322_24985, partial [Chloroflexi bacterium]|nr:hypothetical protein [Chloroflexota bacterium]